MSIRQSKRQCSKTVAGTKGCAANDIHFGLGGKRLVKPMTMLDDQSRRRRQMAMENPQKLQTARKGAACPNPLDEEEEEGKQEKESADGLDPGKYPVTDRRCHAPATAATEPPPHSAHAPAKLLDSFPKSGGHTSIIIKADT